MVGIALAVVLATSSCIDYWGEGCGVQPQPKTNKEQKVKQKRESKEELLKKLYRESLNWTPKDISPLERYVATHPQDRKAVEYLRKYLEEKQFRSCLLEKALLNQPSDECYLLLSSRKKASKKLTGKKQVVSENKADLSRYRFLLFYSPTCPHCQRVLPYALEKLKDYDLVLISSSDKDAVELFSEWRVDRVPTLVAVDKQSKVAYRVVGLTPEKLRNFLSYLVERKDAGKEAEKER